MKKYFLLAVFTFLLVTSNYCYGQFSSNSGIFAVIGVNSKTENSNIENGINIDVKKTELKGNEPKSGIDSLESQNEIEKVWSDGINYYVSIRLEEDNTQIQLKLFNMLGKEISDIYEGSADDGDVFEFSSDLKNGIYICVLNGPNMRDAEKLIISR